MANKNPEIKYVFFGTPWRAKRTLEILKENGLMPSLIVTQPDRRAGRGKQMKAPEVKEWALAQNIPFLQPEKLDDHFVSMIKSQWSHVPLGVVVAYGKIIPQKIIDIFPKGIINIHYSLLPLYRGATPVETQILDGAENVGVTIMLIDAKMDHGPILAQEAIPMPDPLPTNIELTEILADLGSNLLAETLPQWIDGEIEPQEQDHSLKTHSRKFDKSEGEIDLSANPVENLRKIQAFQPWPSTYFFKDGKRIKITKAHLENGKLVIDRVIPEGKSEVNYDDFLKSS